MAYQEPVQFAVLPMEVIDELTPDAGVTIDGVKFSQADGVVTNTISEFTAAAGVTFNGVQIKDSAVVPTFDRLVIDRQLSAVPTAVTSGTVIFLDDGTNFQSYDLMVRQNDGSTSQTGMLAPRATTYSSSVVTGADVNTSSSWRTITTLALVPGTYLVSYSVVLTSPTNVMYCQVSATAGGTGTIEASKVNGFDASSGGGAIPVACSFLLTVASTNTYVWEVRQNTSSGELIINQEDKTVGGATYAVNNPIITAIRLI